MSKKIEITCSGSKSLPIDDLKDFQGNLKKLPKAELEKLKRSIINHGFSFPVFVWRKNILDGHQRLFATKELLKEGYAIDDIPVVEIKAKNKKHAAQKLLLLNSRYADFTEDGISAFIKDFDFELPDIEDISLPDFEIEDFLGNDGDDERLTDPDDIPEAPEEPITKTGDLWILGNHRLLCGDSIIEADVKRLMNGEKAIFMATDPPYGVNFSGAKYNPRAKKWDGIKNDELTGDNLKNFILCLLNVWFKNCDKKTSFYFWTTAMQEGAVAEAIIDSGLHIQSQIIWVKNTLVLGQADYQWKHENCWYAFWKGQKHQWFGGRDKTTVWNVDKIANSSYLHPMQKPVDLYKIPIEHHTKQNQLCCDPFCGSGTQLIAAESTNRRCYGMEIDPKYCDIAVKRWEDYTGKKAQLVNANDPN